MLVFHMAHDLISICSTFFFQNKALLFSENHIHVASSKLATVEHKGAHH